MQEWGRRCSLYAECPYSVQELLNTEVNTSLFATTSNHLQLYHSPRAKILAFKQHSPQVSSAFLTHQNKSLLFIIMHAAIPWTIIIKGFNDKIPEEED